MDYEKRTFNIHFFHVNESGNAVEDEKQFEITSCYDVTEIMNGLIRRFNNYVEECEYMNVEIIGIDEVGEEDEDEDEPYVITTNRYGATFKVYAPENVLEELREDEKLIKENPQQYAFLTYDWPNCKCYFDNDGNGYGVDVDGNVVDIYPY